MGKFTVVHRFDEESKRLKEIIEKRLLVKGEILDEAHPDTVFVVGGDGTFLRCVQDYINDLDHITFYGLHTGTLGFFMNYKSDEIDCFIDDYLNKKAKLKTYPLLVAKTSKNTVYALNEIRIENVMRTQAMQIDLNKETFEEFQGTGICVSSQLGSTAYNRSIGGAVVMDGLNVLQITEIAGIHHKAYRSLGASLIVKDDTIVRLASDDFSGAILGYDAKFMNLDDVTEVEISYCKDVKVKVLSGKDVDYFDRLHSLF